MITARPFLFGGVNLCSQGCKLQAPSRTWSLVFTSCSGPNRDGNQPVLVGVPWLPSVRGLLMPPTCHPLRATPQAPACSRARLPPSALGAKGKKTAQRPLGSWNSPLKNPQNTEVSQDEPDLLLSGPACYLEEQTLPISLHPSKLLQGFELFPCRDFPHLFPEAHLRWKREAILPCKSYSLTYPTQFCQL